MMVYTLRSIFPRDIFTENLAGLSQEPPVSWVFGGKILYIKATR